jgi:hypothetical protein
LDLLEADADGLSQLLLGEAQKPATAAKPLADMEVDGVSHGLAPLIAAVPPLGPPVLRKGREQGPFRAKRARFTCLQA